MEKITLEKFPLEINLWTFLQCAPFCCWTKKHFRWRLCRLRGNILQFVYTRISLKSELCVIGAKYFQFLKDAFSWHRLRYLDSIWWRLSCYHDGSLKEYCSTLNFPHSRRDISCQFSQKLFSLQIQVYFGIFNFGSLWLRT